MQVALRHPSTGSMKFVGTGWNWSLFMGAGFLGLPLFFRGLPLWGTLMMILWVVQIAVPFAGIGGGDTLETFLNVVVFCLCLYLGFKGNAVSARRLVAYGYELANPNSTEARVAADRWGI